MKKNKVIGIVILLIWIILILVLLIAILAIKSKSNPNDGIEQMKEGGIAYNESQLNNFTINIQGLTTEIEEKISNKENFNLKFKEYIYIHGLVDAENAIIDKWQVKDDVLYMILKLDNKNQTNLIVKIDSDNIEITEYNNI